jgi:site-specific DNA-methyltransferase (adenine-specific)
MSVDLFGHEVEERSKWSALFSAETDEWPTDQAVVDDLGERFGPFMLDVAATPTNAKAPRFFTLLDNGLAQSWHVDSGAVWCNPPYSDVEAWIAKGLEESARGVVVVFLLPARTDTRWFHMVLAAQSRCRILFARGRLRFGDAKSSAPFPSVVVVMGAA